MKILFGLFLITSLAHAGAGEELWSQLDSEGKAKLMSSYLKFFAQAGKQQAAGAWQIPPQAMRALIESSGTDDPIAMLAEAQRVGDNTKLPVLFTFADSICQARGSSSSSMCQELQRDLVALRANLSSNGSSATELNRTVELVSETETQVRRAGFPPAGNCVERRDPQPLPDLGLSLFTDLRRDLAATSVRPAPLTAVADPGTGNIVPFRHDTPTRDGHCAKGTSGGFYVLTSETCGFNMPRELDGITFSTDGNWPYMQSGPRISPTMHRVWEFSAMDGSRSRPYINIEDNILASCPSNDPNHDYQDSCNVKSLMVLFPRRSIPNAERVGDDIRVTLSTGEVVVFDARTRTIRPNSGSAMSEGAPDFTIDRQRRQPPNVSYTGAGISVTLSSRFQDLGPRPESGADLRATVTQNGRTCTVPRATVFDDGGNIRNADDAAMVAILNRACPGKNFTLP